MAYAQDTTVPIARTREAIEALLVRAGASEVVVGYEVGRRAVIAFAMKQVRAQLHLPMPERKDFRLDARGYSRADGTIEKFWQAEQRRRWRALYLVVKAKLEAVESGISSLEAEFLANVLLPDGRTLIEFVQPQLPGINASMPAMLPLPPERKP